MRKSRRPRGWDDEQKLLADPALLKATMEAQWGNPWVAKPGRKAAWLRADRHGNVNWGALRIHNG